MKVRFKLNGKWVDVEVSPLKTLLEVLRENFNLTGTKEGCGKGECGACTVILDGKAVNSCLIPISQVDGKEVITIEGITKNNELHPIQKAFIEEGAVQCGFCTPGFVMSVKALLDKKKKPSDEEIKEAIEGNLCRCTGYVKILKAIKKLIQK
ncbi:MAG: (2Fe-2S)-binding protein [Caldiserica bacterium]|nr:MAG: (2Fe-2S)-binding protein [Caldisericota bacterium]